VGRVADSKLQSGKKMALCCCFCDGTHRQLPGRGPAIVEVTEETSS